MKLRTYLRPAALLLLLPLAPLLSPGAARAATVPPLGTAATFAVLGGSTVTNTGPTTVMGDLGVSPGTAVTGFPPGLVSGGVIHANDAVASQAQSDVTTAYNSAAGQPCDVQLTGQDLGGKTLTPGVYCFSSSAQLTGQLTLDGQGNPSSVFIFQIGSTLTTASNSSVVFINTNGAQPCGSNIFWQVGSSATLGTATSFTGNILALASITLNTGTNTNGGLYARNGAVTLDTNNVVRNNQVCSTATATATNSPTNTATATNSPTNTATATNSPTATAISTATPTDTAISTATPTDTAISTATATNSPTSTATPIDTVTATSSPTNTVTATSSPIDTAISTATPTSAVVSTGTATPTGTATGTSAPTGTATSTVTPTDTATSTATLTGVATPTGTATGPTTLTSTTTSTATVQAVLQTRYHDVTRMHTNVKTIVRYHNVTRVHTHNVTRVHTKINNVVRYHNVTRVHTKINNVVRYHDVTRVHTKINSVVRYHDVTRVTTVTRVRQLTTVRTVVNHKIVYTHKVRYVTVVRHIIQVIVRHKTVVRTVVTYRYYHQPTTGRFAGSLTTWHGALPPVEASLSISRLGIRGAPVWARSFVANPDGSLRYDIVPAYGVTRFADSAPLGQPGLSLMSGHDDINGSIFRYLGQMQRGDVIQAWRGTHAFRYVVTSVHVVTPDDVRLLDAAYTRPTLALISCTPYWVDTHRVVVIAQMQ